MKSRIHKTKFKGIDIIKSSKFFGFELSNYGFDILNIGWHKFVSIGDERYYFEFIDDYGIAWEGFVFK